MFDKYFSNDVRFVLDRLSRRVTLYIRILFLAKEQERGGIDISLKEENLGMKIRLRTSKQHLEEQRKFKGIILNIFHRSNLCGKELLPIRENCDN